MRQPVTQFARFFAIYARPGSQPAASALPSFSCFRQSIVSQRRLVLTLFIYIPSAITMAAISDFILSVLWGLQPYCPLFCVNFTAAPPKKQPVAVVVIYILRTFALKLSIVTLYVPCLLTLWTALMSARWLSVMNSTVPLIPPILWLVALPFMRHRPIVLAFIYAWPATHSYLFFLPSAEKKSSLVACKIYIFLTFAY